MARLDDWKEAKSVSYSPPKSSGVGGSSKPSAKPSASGGSIRAANDESSSGPVKYTPPAPKPPTPAAAVVRQSSFSPQDQGSFTTEKEYLLRALQAAVFGPIETVNRPVSYNPVNIPNGKVAYPSGPRGNNNGYAQPIAYNPGGWSGTAGQIIPTDTGYMSPNYKNAYATTTTGGKTYTPGEWSVGGRVMPGATQGSLGLVDPREYLAAGMIRSQYGMADPYTAWQTRQDYMRQRYQTPKRMGLNMPDWMVGVGDLRGSINWKGEPTPNSGNGSANRYGGGYRGYSSYGGYSSDYAKTLYPENGSGGYAPNGYGNADFFASLTNWRI